MAQRRHVRSAEIALAQMNEVATLFDGKLPVIIDDELRASATAEIPRLADLRSRLLGRAILDAQLHQARTRGQQAWIHAALSTIG